MIVTPAVLKHLGKGAVQSPQDERDYKYADLIVGAVMADWSKEFRLPEPPDSDQGSALRCVGEATSYYHWQLKKQVFSPRDIYSQVFLPQGGAYLVSGPQVVCSQGQQSLVECGNPNPNNEANNRIKCANPQQALDGLEASYFNVNAKNIDEVAHAIQNNNGCIIGVQGDDRGWGNLEEPSPPVNAEWGHALYLFGTHMHDGQKCVIAKSSWCNTGVKEHHIKQNYLDSGNTFEGRAIIAKGNAVQFKTQNYKGELRIVLEADSEATWQALCKVYGVSPTEITETIN